MNSILIDTDVILDFFFDRKPFSDDASTILSLCENKKIKGFITPVMISNIYYILRKLAKHDREPQLAQLAAQNSAAGARSFASQFPRRRTASLDPSQFVRPGRPCGWAPWIEGVQQRHEGHGPQHLS